MPNDIMNNAGQETGNGAAQQQNGAGDSGTTGTQNSNGDNAQNNLSEFDKFLQGEGMQAEFDRRVTKALTTQKAKLDADTQAQIDNAVSEALKVAKMTKDEQARHEAEKKAKELDDREAKILKRELQATAKESLIEKGLPVSLADTINYTDADSVTKSIDALAKAFQESVQTQVEEKLKGGKPITKADENTATLEAQIKDAIKRSHFG